MSREVHVRFCEGLGVKFPRATHLLAGRSQASPDLQLTVLRRWVDCAT